MTGEIHKRYEVPYPLSVVYNAWVSSDTVVPPATAMHIEPHVGGAYRLMMPGVQMEGTFLEVAAPNLVRYTWQWQGDDERTEVTARFTADGDATVVEVLHVGFASETSRANHDTGWDSYVQGFVKHLDENG